MELINIFHQPGGAIDRERIDKGLIFQPKYQFVNDSLMQPSRWFTCYSFGYNTPCGNGGGDVTAPQPTSDALAIRACHTRRYKVTKDSKHGLPVADNLLARNFTLTAPNQVWTSDITYLWTDEGWLYLAIVLNLFNREVIGWSLKPRMTSDIVTDALTMA